MVRQTVIIKQTVADNIASIAWYIESKGLISTADKFADNIYDYFISLGDKLRIYPFCREPKRRLLGYKCISYKKKYDSVY